MRKGSPVKKALQLAVIGILVGVGHPADVGAALVVDSAAVTPASVPVGVATTATVTARISEPSVLPDGVNLQRLDSAGRVVSVLGLLHDDGSNGDAVAGDGVFTLRATIFEQTPGPMRLRVSAAFRGAITRALSSPLTINITGTTGTGIAILAPADLAYLNTSPIIVSGTVGDPQANVTINGVPASVSGGSFQASVPLVEGTNTLTAVASNSGGTTSTASLQVTLDTTPPRVTIESPVDGLVTTDASVTVSGSVNDIVVGTVNSQQAQVTVNGAAAQVANRSFVAAGIALVLGPNTIQAIGRDRSGNSATTSVQ
jgi:glucodextranase-like protein